MFNCAKNRGQKYTLHFWSLAMASLAPGYHDQTNVGQGQNFSTKKSIKFNCKLFKGKPSGVGVGWVLVQIEQMLQNPSEAGAGRKKNEVYTQMQQDILVSAIK